MSSASLQSLRAVACATCKISFPSLSADVRVARGEVKGRGQGPEGQFGGRLAARRHSIEKVPEDAIPEDAQGQQREEGGGKGERRGRGTCRPNRQPRE